MTILEMDEEIEQSLVPQWPKVLAVDDRRENLALIKGIVSKMDAEVVLTSSGAEALAAMEEEEFAVVLLDVTMPGMDGFEVARRMKTNGQLTQVPVIFLTAMDRDETAIMNGYDAGVVDFLFKPVNPSILRSKVQVFLNLFNCRKAQETANGKLIVMQQDLIRKRSAAESAAREISIQRVELEHRNAELSRQNRDLDNFAHVVSHDLRQPLGSVLDYLDLIAIECVAGSNNKAMQWITSCQKLGQSMNALIGDVLEYASVSNQPMVLQPTDCDAVLATVLERMRASIKDNQATVVYDQLPRVMGAERLLIRVFQNLISNALQYRSAADPEIEVRCEWDQSRRNWMFRFIDNGRGVDPKDMTRIFEMFARSHVSSAIPGTGIGLAICKRIIEAHGGRIWIRPHPGAGSEFCFALPDCNGSEPEGKQDLCPTPDC